MAVEGDMASASQHQAVLDAVAMLADQIARASPESAEQAMQIVKLVQELAPAADRDLIKDALDAETADSDVSDARVQSATDAVMRAVRTDR
jgi:hypothetical protein